MASSSSSRPHKYDVFLSFRGTDTRNSFVGHLHRALTAKGIKTYIDEESLERGDKIAYSLLEAIHDSKASVVVLSENYASSRWCLDELVHIIQCRDNNGLIVVTVFFHVEPTHVRKQEGRFGDAFSKLKLSKRFKDDEEKLSSWTTALSRVSDLSGWDSSVIRSEVEMLDKIVKDVERKLEQKYKPSNKAKGLVGIEERVEKVKSLLCIGNNQGTLVLGLWGMGGIGKTTLAKEVFNDLCSKFEGCCFYENVRENWNGKKEKLRNKLHSKLLKEKKPYNAEERLSNKNVLIVLDDVNDPDQLDDLVKYYSYFGHGSRIIVTTRDMQMLRYLNDAVIYKVKELNRSEARKLFDMTAFRSRSLTDLETGLLSRVLSYCQGVPLAIKVLGSHLSCKEKENWGIEMDKLEQYPNDKIQNVLKISYKGLDETNKRIFLDIACFFKGSWRVDVENVLDGKYAKSGIDDLIEKSLLNIGDDWGELLMHDLVQEMGRQVVNSIQKREKRSRLWNSEDVVHVLKNNIGSGAIEGIFLVTENIKTLYLSPDLFKGMHNLRLLDFKDVSGKLKFPQGLHDLPDELRLLKWSDCPLEYFPQKFNPCKLVELRMRDSQLRELWHGVQDLPNLKIIVLYGSVNLTRIPDLSLAPNLEYVELSECTSLVQIPPLSFRTPEQHATKHSSFISYNVGWLGLEGCSSLETLPKISGYVERLNLESTKVRELSTASGIGLMEYLTHINLSYSSSFNEFPKQLPRSIEYLDLSGTAIENVPSSIEHVAGTLQELYLHNCKRLVSLPTNLYMLKKLVRLDLHRCSNLIELPALPPVLKDLEASQCTMVLKDYSYCFKLNENAIQNILLEYQIRNLRTATMSMGKQVRKNQGSGVTIFVPGNEIPQWFSYRSAEAFITVNLPENWRSTEFIGFALCISTTCKPMSITNLSCDYYYRNIKNSRSQKFNLQFFTSYSDIRDYTATEPHLLMWYMGKNYHHYLDAVNITFEYNISNNIYGCSRGKVNGCGVRLLKWEDAEEFGICDEAEQGGNCSDSTSGVDMNSYAESESDSEEYGYPFDGE